MEISPVEGNGSSYFTSYGDIGVHELMLKDRPRTLAYKRFTETNKHLFANKIVLDVGAGTGVLSLFASSAGAKHVYAVEASNMALACRKVVECNGMEDCVTVIQGKIEDIELPVEKVDIIISEWMGFYLLHESMLDSVIFARDKWLCETGIMVPSSATLYLTPVNMDSYVEEHFKFWEDVYGYDFSPLQTTAMVSALSQPVIESIQIDQKLAEPKTVVELDLKTAKLQDVQNVKEKLVFKIENNGRVHGFASWFDVDFTGPDNEKGLIMTNPVVLSTSPSAPQTHWKQTTVFLPAPFKVEKGETISCKIELGQDDVNKRQYNISLEMLDDNCDDDNTDVKENESDASEDDFDDDEEDESQSHPVPCNCGSERCSLILAIMNKFDKEQEELETEAEYVDTTAEIQAALAMDADSLGTI